MSADPNLAAGIAAVQAGDLARAQTLLAAVVRTTPASVEGWWWLAQAVTSPERRQFCLERVLALDPLHVGALRLLASGAAAPSAAPEPEPAPPPPPTYGSPLLRAVRQAPPGVPAAEPAPVGKAPARRLRVTPAVLVAIVAGGLLL